MLGGVPDGLVDELFYYVWKKNPLKPGPAVLSLPDTIVYKWDMPSVWYFTARDGSIRVRRSKNYTKQTIAQQFLKKIGPSQIVAMYIASPKGADLFQKRRYGAIAK